MEIRTCWLSKEEGFLEHGPFKAKGAPVLLLSTARRSLGPSHMMDGMHCWKTKLFINIPAHDKGVDLT